MSAAKTLTGHSDAEDIFSFSNADAEVVLANIGDFGTDNADESKVSDLVYSWRPDAIFTNGDNTYSMLFFYDDAVGDYYGEFVERDLLWPSPGNHDWDDGSLASYFVYFGSVVSKRYYYKKVFGPVAIYFLDSNAVTPDGNTVGSKQYDWLARELANSRSTWNIVAMHHAPYSSSSGHGSSEDLQWGFGDLGADIVFAGHNHVYERVTGDTTYITNGSGGSHLYGFGAPVSGSQVRYNSKHGAGKLTASPTRLVWQFHSYDGALVDRLVMEK